MKTFISIACSIPLLLVASSAHAQQQDEPAELKYLMEQYQAKLRSDAKPVTEKLLSEMKKLEQRLIKDSRLSDALTVQKKQKEMLNAASTPKLAPDKEVFKLGKSKEDLKLAMTNSVWALKHSGNGTILNVVVFLEDGSCIISSAINGRWKAIEKDKVEVSASNLPQTAIMNFSDKNMFTYQYGSGDVVLSEYYGRITPKK